MDLPHPSPPSSPSSFHTAPRSPMSISEDPDPDPTLMAAITHSARKPRYRPAIQIPSEVLQHCHIYLDEQLYTNALTLLADLVTAGASHPDCLERPCYVPIPFHIELISALLIHPRHTTQAPPNCGPELASRAITLLRSILSILGPLNANLTEAFCLSPLNSSRTSRRRRNAAETEDASSGSDSDERSSRMKGIIANNGRIRKCAKDFWHMVGWAFNCSVKHPKRWKYWKVWLDFMLDVLDADWEEREAQDGETQANPKDQFVYKAVRQSLLVQYLSDTRCRSSAVKRVVRSAFADGGLDSLREFPEVFPNETRELKTQTGQKRKRGGVEHRFGDYDDDEAESAFESPELADQIEEHFQEGGEVNMPRIDRWLGGTESILLRQRVITLLSRVAAYLPDCFENCKEVYDVISSCVKPLPLPAFSLLLSPSRSSQLLDVVIVSLSQFLLLSFLPNSAPRPQIVSGKDGDSILPDILERCFLPFCATTSSTSENAKVSILVENLFRLYIKSCGCYHRASLDAAIEKGILARENKIRGDKRRKEIGTRHIEEESERVWLNASGERLRSLLALVKEKDCKTTGVED